MCATEEQAERIRALRNQIVEIKKRLPKHTPSVAIMLELEEAEYELRGLLAKEASESEEDCQDTGAGQGRK